MANSPQILLPLERPRPDRLEDFVVGANAAVVAALEELLATPGAALFLHGAAGSGKSHLLNAVCNRALERGLNAFYLGLGNQPDSAAEGLSGLESSDLVCFDDIDSVVGKPAWETALFHSFNRLRECQSRLVVSSSQPLSALAFQLPDLRSRLGWGLRLSVEPLDDDGKSAVLQAAADALGYELPADVKQYLLRRGPRNLGRLVDTLEAIRRAALTGKRRITVPLAREILDPD